MRENFEKEGFEYLFTDDGGEEMFRRQTKLGVATMGAGANNKPWIQIAIKPEGKASITVSEIFIDRPPRSVGFSNHVAIAAIDDIDVDILFNNLKDYEKRVVDAFAALT